MSEPKSINKVIDLLGLKDYELVSSEESSVYELPDDNAFGKVYVKLESNDDFEVSDDHVLLNTHAASLKYFYKNTVEIELRGDFDQDIYKVVITEA